MSSDQSEVVENLAETQAAEATAATEQLAVVSTEVEEAQAKGPEAKAVTQAEEITEAQPDEIEEGKQAAEAPAAETEPAAPQKSLRELKEEELAQVNAAVSSNNLLFYSPNMDEIMEQLRAEKEARREAEEAERRERRLADLDPEITSHRRRRRRRGDADLEFEGGTEGDPEDTIVKVRAPRLSDSHSTNRVTGVRGSAAAKPAPLAAAARLLPKLSSWPAVSPSTARCWSARRTTASRLACSKTAFWPSTLFPRPSRTP